MGADIAEFVLTMFIVIGFAVGVTVCIFFVWILEVKFVILPVLGFLFKENRRGR